MPHHTLGERSRSGDAGATLIELLIAIVILLIGLVPVAQMITSGLSSDLNNRSNSVALVTAQRELEQMRQQIMAVNGGGPCTALAGSYYFCDADAQTVGIGQTGAGNTPTQIGCPLDAAKVQLDFTQTTAACAAGYFVTKLVPWNPVNQTTISVEVRWRVVTEINAGAPVRKFIILGARAAQPRAGTLITNLQTVVGPQ